MADYGHGDLSWWSKSRFGMFLHFGLYSTAARQEWVRHFERISNEAYQKYFDHFDPDLFDGRMGVSGKEGGDAVCGSDRKTS